MAGGSYGGQCGHDSEGEFSNLVYGSYREPDASGSGGGGANGGAGGGNVRISADRLVVKGSIVARGADVVTAPYQGGGGAGGTINIRVQVLEGAGSMDAAGGVNWHRSPTFRHAGSGGRIAVWAQDYSQFESSRIKAAQHLGQQPAGTVYIRDTDALYGELVIDGAGDYAGPTPVGDGTLEEAVIEDAMSVRVGGYALTRGQVTFRQEVRVNVGTWRVEGSRTTAAGAVTVAAGGRLVAETMVAADMTVAAGDVVTALDPTATDVHRLELEVTGTLTLGGLIDVSGKGYLAGRTVGGTTEGGAKGGAGGSYGGQCGPDESGSPSNEAYEDYRNSTECGSGGGGAGGGYVKIVADRLVLNGGQVLAWGATRPKEKPAADREARSLSPSEPSKA